MCLCVVKREEGSMERFRAIVAQGSKFGGWDGTFYLSMEIGEMK